MLQIPGEGLTCSVSQLLVPWKEVTGDLSPPVYISNSCTNRRVPGFFLELSTRDRFYSNIFMLCLKPSPPLFFFVVSVDKTQTLTIMLEVSHILYPTQPSTRLPHLWLSLEFHKVKLLPSSPTYLFILQDSVMHPPDNLVFSFSFVCVCVCMTVCVCM